MEEIKHQSATMGNSEALQKSDNGMFTIYQLVQDFASIHSKNMQKPYFPSDLFIFSHHFPNEMTTGSLTWHRCGELEAEGRDLTGGSGWIHWRNWAANCLKTLADI